MRIEDLYNHNHKLSNTHSLIKGMYILPAFILSIVSNSTKFHLSVLILFVMLTIIVTNISIVKYLKLISLPGIFVILGCFTLIVKFSIVLFGDGEREFKIGIDENTYPIAIGIFFKSYALISVVYFWLLTYTISEIAQNMLACKIPKLFIELFVLTYKFIYLLTSNTQRLLIAQKSRLGYVSVKQNSINSFAFLFGAVFKKSMEQTDQIEIAMKSRLGNNEFLFVKPKQSFSKSELFIPLVLLTAISLLFYYI